MNERMDTQLLGLVAFTMVAELESFSAAAQALSLPLATVSRRVAALEAEIGVRLLNRTTRRLSLTDMGTRYLEHGRRIVDGLAAAKVEAAAAKAGPEGIVRLTAPVLLGRYRVVPMLRHYLSRYPSVRISVHLTDRVLDPVAEGFDLALRGGELPDSSLVGKRVGQIVSGLFAAPHLAADLDAHPGFGFLAKDPIIDVRQKGLGARVWTLVDTARQRSQKLTIKPRHEVNDAEAAAELAAAGLGICSIPLFVGERLVASGELVHIRPEITSAVVPIHLLFPSRRGLVPAVRILGEELAGALLMEPTSGAR